MRLNTTSAKTQITVWLLVTLVALSTTSTSCSAHRPKHVWTDAVLRAEALQYEGKYAQAENAYQKLLPEAPSTERRRWVLLDLAELAEERGDDAEALARYERVWSEDIIDRFGANAMFSSAALLYHDDPEASLELSLRTIRRYPAEVASERALEHLIEHHLRHQKHGELLELLEKLHVKVEGTAIADNLVFRAGQYHDRVLDDPNAALERYRALYARYPGGPLADDALWEMARIYMRHQQWEPVISLLELLAADDDESWFVGTYRSNYADDALLILGRIHLLFLDEYDVAVEYFGDYVDKFPYSLEADDAAWLMVEARRLQGDDDAHLNALRRFVSSFPESRYVDTARGRLGETTDDSG